MDWDDLRIFIAIARDGSIRGAASNLGIAHSTVSRRLGRLEDSLQTRLFDRLTNGFVLTAAGEKLLDNANQLDETIAGIERDVLGQDTRLSGKVRLTIPLVLATSLFMKHFAPFIAQYPDIDFEIDPSDEVRDLSKREADIALRFVPIGKSPPDHLVGRKVGVSHRCAYATQDYLDVHTLDSEKPTGTWLGWGDETRFPSWVRQSPFPHMPAIGTMPDVLLQAAAAKHSIGVALLPCFLGDQSEGLVRVPGYIPDQGYSIWLLTHADLRDTARLRLFRDFMADVARKEAAVFEGRLEDG